LNKHKKLSILYIIVPIVLLFYVIFILEKLNSYNENRIYSIRKVPDEYRISLVERFIDKNYKNNSILVLGDSQPNGHLFPEKFIFSKLLENKLNKNILNLAFQDSRILDNTIILEYLIENNLKFDSIIFNVNQSHIKVNNFSHLKKEKDSYYILGILKESKAFRDFVENPNPIILPSDKLKLTKYNDYFSMSEQQLTDYINKLEVFIDLAKKISDNVIIYITPHSINAVKYNNEKDIEILNKFSHDIIKFCENKGVKCIDIDITEDNYYIDIVHFNSKGHEKMSEIFYDILK
jgi:hypothetical protein